MNWSRSFLAVTLTFGIIVLLDACWPAPTATNAGPNLPALSNLPPGWTKIEPADDTCCAHNTPHAFWVRPGLSNRVFVYFQGGGGCYNAETCGMKGSYKDAVTDNDNPTYTIGGVFNLDHNVNCSDC